MKMNFLQQKTKRKNCKSKRPKQENAQVEIQTVLRLRPLLLKRERDEQIVVEPIKNTNYVVLHPLPSRPHDILSPNSTFTKQSITPRAFTNAADVEFAFDRVLGTNADQSTFYTTVGHPIAQVAMDPLKEMSEDDLRTHLVIGMGLSSSGKTFTCFGSNPIKNRKHGSDGLVPRMMDSFFNQYKHQVSSSGTKKRYEFAVNLSVVQVNQNKTNADDCHLHDLLHSPATKGIAQSLASLAFRPHLSRSRTISSASSSTSNEKPDSGHTLSSTSSSSAYKALDEPVLVRQDPESADFFLINGQIRTCSSVDEGRESLSIAIGAHRKAVSHSKRYFSHVLVQMQPVLLHHDKIVKAGDRVAVLDMDHPSILSSQTRVSQTKDSSPVRSDAYVAVFNCLRNLQHNEIVKNGLVIDSPTSINGRPSLRRQKSLKKVPYRQHAVTKLLQPLFSAHHTDKTIVTLVLTAAPGHSYHAENKVLLQELDSLHHPVTPNLSATQRHEPVKLPDATILVSETKKDDSIGNASDADDEVSLEDNCKTNRPAVPLKSLNKTSGTLIKRKPSSAAICILPNSVPVVPMVPLLEREPSMTYSDTTVEDELPPPIAPSFRLCVRASQCSYNEHCIRKSHSRSPVRKYSFEASAPSEDEMCDDIYCPIVPTLDAPRLPGTSYHRGGAIKRSPIQQLKSPQHCATTYSAKQSLKTPLPCDEVDEIEQHQKVEQLDNNALRVGSDAAPRKSSTTNTVTSPPLQPSSAQNTSSALQKFSPMKTIHKVVHASQKKGYNFLEKMSTSACSSHESSSSENHDQLRKLIDALTSTNEKLKNEKAALQTENEEIKEELRFLKMSMPQKQLNSVHASISGTDIPSRSDDDDYRKVGVDLPNNSNSELDQENSPRAWCDDRRTKSDMFDNALFQQMAKMNNIGSWNI